MKSSSCFGNGGEDKADTTERSKDEETPFQQVKLVANFKNVQIIHCYKSIIGGLMTPFHILSGYAIF